MNKNEILEISREYGLNPSKNLGQNFLVSDEIRERITGLLHLREKKKVLEIGPGLGSLTELIADSGAFLTAVEIDSGFAGFLKKRFGGRENVTIIHEDFLKADIDAGFSCIVSNLPYYCSSEILFKLAAEFTAPDLFVMLQKELAERITSGPGEKSYGALTLNLGIYFESSKLFDIPRSAFYPRPDVISSFMHLRRREMIGDMKKREIFHLLVKSAFWGRRKTILKSLSASPHMGLSREKVTLLLEKSGIEKSTRGEELGMEEFLRITCLVLEEGMA
jgi:16S rRNA (adenine1518-N6/adenine1519-N6)-dimethyltransferase